MQAIILAAGEAKRLRPLTESTPKCLLELDGKAIIEYQIDNLIKAGVAEAVVVTGFMADKLEEHLLATYPEYRFTFVRSKDYSKTYPAHGLWLAKDHLTETFLYLNADVVFHPEILKRVIESEHKSVTAIQKTAWDEEEVNVVLGKDSSSIVEIGKYVSKSLSDGEFIGVTKIDEQFGKQLIKVLDDFVKKKELKKFAADAINLAIQRGSIMNALDVTDLPAIEVDTQEDFAAASKKITEIKNQNAE